MDSKTEKNSTSQNKVLFNAASIDLASIFSQLHVKALKKAQEKVKDVTILNSAIENKDKFTGAGEHMLLAANTDGKIDKELCRAALEEYINWFSGPDIGKTITIDTIVPMTQPMSDDEIEQSKQQDTGNEETNDKDTEGKKQNDTETESNESLQVKSLLYRLFESTQQEDEEKAKANNEKINGYYVQYEVEIGDQKKSSFDSAIKNLAKQGQDFLKSIGITFSSWMDGAAAKTYTIGDIVDRNKISIDKLPSAVSKTFKNEYPEMQPTISVLNVKSILSHLKTRLDAKMKAALQATKYALCIKVNKNEKNYETLSKQDIADLVNNSVESFSKALKKNGKITKDQVIYISNYDDNKKDKNDNTFNKKEESIDVKKLLTTMSMIFENLDKDSYIELIEGKAEDKKKYYDALVKMLSDSKIVKVFTANTKLTNNQIQELSNSKIDSKEELQKRLNKPETGLQTLNTDLLRALKNDIQQIKDKIDSGEIQVDSDNDKEEELSDDKKKSYVKKIQEVLKKYASSDNQFITALEEKYSDSELSSYKYKSQFIKAYNDIKAAYDKGKMEKRGKTDADMYIIPMKQLAANDDKDDVSMKLSNK